jgi:riboflavin kinase/FMN adenylyltransferase
VLTIKNTENFRIEKPTILTIGTFDGVHLGHQKILNRLKELKKKHQLNTVVLTFDPHPRKVLFPEQNDLKLITTTAEKLALLENYGIDIAVVYPFSKKFAQLDASVYIKDILVKSLKVKHLIIGYDHKFGKNREGNIISLKSFSSQFNYEVEEISAQDIESINISSSKIRHAIEKGDIELANKFLGHTYFLSGTVIKAKQLGRTIGFPTANISIEDEDKLIPAIGVYWVEVELENERFYGMLNVGKNPTTDFDDHTKIEVNMFNFNKDIYGSTLKVHFLKRLRDEVKFKNIDELKTQLATDKETCMKLIEQKK